MTSSTRRNAILAACGLTMAAAVLAGCTGSSSSSPRAASSSTSSYCFDGASARQNNLAVTLTSALQKHDRNAFLATTHNDAARTAMGKWWDNVSAIGFTTGAVQPTSDAPDAETTNPSETFEVGIGLHNAFDDSTGDDTDRKPNVVATHYQLTANIVHGKDTHCSDALTGFKSLENAPWDGDKLLVIKSAHTVVAGSPTDAATVRRIAPLAENAAKYLIKFYGAAKRGDDIPITGHILFVPTSNDQANHWFTYQKKPSGWAKDVGNADGVQYPLGGVQTPPAGITGVKLSQVSEVGGGRVVITRTGVGESNADVSATLVHEFTHNLYDTYSSGWFTGKPTDAALAEGAARYIETFYRADPTNKANTQTLKIFAPVLRTHFGGFNGRTPTASQIYGAGSLANYYYDLSATSFTYLAKQYGLTFALQSIRDAYANGGGPFSGVVIKNDSSGLTFGNESTFETRWATWLRKSV